MYPSFDIGVYFTVTGGGSQHTVKRPMRATVMPSGVGGKASITWMFVPHDPAAQPSRYFSSVDMVKASLPKKMVTWLEGSWSMREYHLVDEADAQRMLVWLDQVEEQGLSGLAGVKDIPAGRTRKGERDYSAVLPPELRKLLQLVVEEKPANMDTSTFTAIAMLRKNGEGKSVGSVRGYTKPNGYQRLLVVEESHIDEAWRNRGLGKALYEALYREAWVREGVTHIRGETHSTSAHRVHESLANKHGWQYDALPNNEEYGGDWPQEQWEEEPKGDGYRDDRWQKYQFPLTGALSGRANRGPAGIDWRNPRSWPATVDLSKLAHDFQVLLGDNFGIDDGVFPLLKLKIDTDLVVPTIDYDDDRDLEEGEPSDRYMADLTAAMAAGELMPPAVVGNDKGNNGTTHGWPYDGRHRLNAAKRLGLKVIPAIDITGRTHVNGLGRMPKQLGAIKDIKRGKRVKVNWAGQGIKVTEWPHLAPPGYRLFVQQYDSEYGGQKRIGFQSVLTKDGAGPDPKNLLRIDEVANANADVMFEKFDWRTGEPNPNGKVLYIRNAYARPDFQRHGLGVPLYEALMASGYQAGARIVAGTVHSTPASRVHQKVAAKHGLAYRAFTMRDEPPDMSKDLAFDERYGQYKYPLNGADYETPMSRAQQQKLFPYLIQQRFSQRPPLEVMLPLDPMESEARSDSLIDPTGTHGLMNRATVILRDAVKAALSARNAIISRTEVSSSPWRAQVTAYVDTAPRAKAFVIIPKFGVTESLREAWPDQAEVQTWDSVATLPGSMAAHGKFFLRNTSDDPMNILEANVADVEENATTPEKRAAWAHLQVKLDKWQEQGLAGVRLPSSSVKRVKRGTLGAVSTPECKPGSIPVQRLIVERVKCVRVKAASPAALVQVIRKSLEDVAQEHVGAMGLGPGNEVLGIIKLGVGGLGSVALDPRVLWAGLFSQGAGAFILYHNHPSGGLEPSVEDIQMTRRLKEQGKMLSIPLLDHVIVAHTGYTSLLEKGQL